MLGFGKSRQLDLELRNIAWKCSSCSFGLFVLLLTALTTIDQNTEKKIQVLFSSGWFKAAAALFPSSAPVNAQAHREGRRGAHSFAVFLWSHSSQESFDTLMLAVTSCLRLCFRAVLWGSLRYHHNKPFFKAAGYKALGRVCWGIRPFLRSLPRDLTYWEVSILRYADTFLMSSAPCRCSRL